MDARKFRSAFHLENLRGKNIFKSATEGKNWINVLSGQTIGKNWGRRMYNLGQKFRSIFSSKKELFGNRLNLVSIIATLFKDGKYLDNIKKINVSYGKIPIISVQTNPMSILGHIARISQFGEERFNANRQFIIKHLNIGKTDWDKVADVMIASAGASLTVLDDSLSLSFNSEVWDNVNNTKFRDKIDTLINKKKNI